MQSIAPYFDPSTGRLRRYDVPHAVVNRWLSAKRRPPLPQWVHSRNPVFRDVLRRVDYMDRVMQQLPSQVLEFPETPVPGAKVDPPRPRDPLDPAYIRRQLVYLQDRSQLLLLRLESVCGPLSGPGAVRPTTAQILQATSGRWEICKEGLWTIMHDGLLPDLAPILQFLPLWNRVQDNPFEHDPFVRSILRIFVKSVFQPSKVREINRSLCNELREPRIGERGPKIDRRRVIDLISKLVFCSLAGFYPHSKYTASYATRRELYRWLVFDVPSIEEMRVWMLDHKLLLTFILREYHIFHMDSVPSLRKVFEDLYEYPSIHNNVLHSMDRTRVRFDEGVRNVLGVLDTFYETRATVDAGKRWRTTVTRSTFVIDTALLDNGGSCMYYYCKKYERDGMSELLREFFWRFTFAGRYEQFNDMLPPESEKTLREIILYWLLLKECCRKASCKQTKRDYLECISKMSPGDIVPDLPAKPAPKTMHMACMHNAKDKQVELIREFKCQCGQATHDKCLLYVIVAIVESFEVHRVIRPANYTPAIGYRTINDRLSIEKYLTQAYTTCLSWCYRPRLTTFADEMVSSCRTVKQLMRVTDGAPSKKQLSLDVVEAFLHAREAYKEHERKDVLALIDKVIRSFPPSREVSVEWMMVSFGISYDAVKAINKARRLMLSETNRRAPYNACYIIAINNPRDFWIIRDFFYRRFEYESIRVYPISRQVTEQQVASLHAKLNLVEAGQPLPPSASTVYYCPHHRTVLAAKVGTESPKKGYVNTLNIGPEGISVDPITGLKYCTSQSQRGDRRSGIADALPPDLSVDDVEPMTPMHTDGEDSMMDEPDDEDDSEAPEPKPKVKKPARKSKQKCTFQPLKTVNLLGRVFQLFRHMYLLCPWCGCPMRYSREKFCEIGIWCGCCIQGEEAVARKLGVPWDPVAQKANTKAIPESIRGVAVKQHLCYWCNGLPRRNQPTTYLLLYDDIETYKLTYIPWCDRHLRPWMGNEPGRMRLSVIVRNLQGRNARDLKTFPYDCRDTSYYGQSRSLTSRVSDMMSGDTDDIEEL